MMLFRESFRPQRMDRLVLSRLASAVVVTVFATSIVASDDVANLPTVIDDFIQRQQEAESVSAAPVVDDHEFLRRVTLDLAGRVPTLSELQKFVAASSPDKRDEAIDRLLSASDFAFHLRNSLDAMLLAPLKSDGGWREWLLEATRENRSWDRVFREIIVPERELADDIRPAAFLQARAQDLDTMTNDASVLLFGVNVACAKCHDHPLVDDWQQSHYYGFASFFKRTFPMRSGFVSERFDGRLKFTTVEGDEHQAEFMFLTGATVEERETELDKDALKKINETIRKAERDKNAPKPPQPEFSPRSELVKLALAPSETDLFSRNIVNRVWAQLIGRGIVHPLDQMHSGNPPTHPELLDTLAADFATNGYNLKRLIRQIVLSRTYARSIRSEQPAEERSSEDFAHGALRPLTPWQLSLSLRVATRNPDRLPDTASEDWPAKREQLEKEAERLVSRFPIPDDTFQVGTDEALLFSNSEEFHRDYLAERDDTLTGHLKNIDDDDKLIRTAFLAVLSRPPSAVETGAVALHLGQRSEQRVQAIQHIVWALLSSPEFRFNH